MFTKLCDQNKVYKNLLGGEWVESESGKLIEIISPVDGSLIGRVQAMTQNEVDRAVENTKESLPLWAEMPGSP